MPVTSLIPYCPQCGTTRIVKLQQLSAADPAADAFRCDACGHRWNAPKGRRDGDPSA